MTIVDTALSLGCEFPTHRGETGYRRGCRCRRCVAAQRRIVERVDPYPPPEAVELGRRPQFLPRGYIWYQLPDHPLSDRGGRVYAHRARLFEKYRGLMPSECHGGCGRWFTSWAEIQADHVNGDVGDNRPENLQPLCRQCNGRDRDRRRHHRRKA